MAIRRDVSPSLAIHWIINYSKKRKKENIVTSTGHLGPVSSMRAPRCGGLRHLGVRDVDGPAWTRTVRMGHTSRRNVCAFLSYDPIPSRPLLGITIVSSPFFFLSHSGSV